MDATQFLEFLTARTIPYKFPNGVPLAKIKGDARQHPDWENRQLLDSVIGTLQNYLHIERDEESRIKTGLRQLVRTTNGELILVGARGPSLIDRIRNLNSSGVEIINQNLSNGRTPLTLDRVKIEEPIEERLEAYVGVVPSDDHPTALHYLVNQQSQFDWFDHLDFLPFEGNPFSNQGGETVKIFNHRTQTLELSTGEKMEFAQKFPFVLIERGGTYNPPLLILRKNTKNEWESASLSTIEDKRRGRIFVSECAKIVPLRWSRINQTLTLPKFLILPPTIMRAVCISSMNLPTPSTTEFYEGSPIESLVYGGIDEQIMGQLSRVLWHGGDLNE